LPGGRKASLNNERSIFALNPRKDVDQTRLNMTILRTKLARCQVRKACEWPDSWLRRWEL
jgi:hypothetical protein